MGIESASGVAMCLRRDVPGIATGSSLIGLTPLLLLFAICGTASAQPLVWTPRGPSPNTQGQVENITDREVSGVDRPQISGWHSDARSHVHGR